MNRKIVILSAALALCAACSSGDDKNNSADSANTLNDTFPAKAVGDTVGLDSNAADETKVDSGNRSTH
jgi:hypothetical protein